MGQQNSLSALKQRPQQRGNLLEYSVVYTDRAVNLMSQPFQQVMIDISTTLKEVYKAKHVAVIPGSGSYAMEAVARQFGTGKKCLVIRNGYFSFRWSDIFAVCKIPQDELVLKAEFCETEGMNGRLQFQPTKVEKAVESILTNKPDVVFAPQVETATGIALPPEYVKQIAKAVHSYGGLLVIDAIAAGTLWLDMEENDVDVLISAPQKGWSGPACCGLVMLNDKAKAIVDTSEPTSFCCNLKKWLEVMQKYEAGGFMYYTTLPTDSLTVFRDAMKETRILGIENVNEKAEELGKKVREMLSNHGYASVALDGFAAPTVAVVYNKGENHQNMVAALKANGLQVAGGVPFKVDEPEELAQQTFRIGLFGLDKLKDINRTVALLETALTRVSK